MRRARGRKDSTKHRDVQARRWRPDGWGVDLRTAGGGRLSGSAMLDVESCEGWEAL